MAGRILFLKHKNVIRAQHTIPASQLHKPPPTNHLPQNVMKRSRADTRNLPACVGVCERRNQWSISLSRVRNDRTSYGPHTKTHTLTQFGGNVHTCSAECVLLLLAASWPLAVVRSFQPWADATQACAHSNFLLKINFTENKPMRACWWCSYATRSLRVLCMRMRPIRATTPGERWHKIGQQKPRGKKCVRAGGRTGQRMRNMSHANQRRTHAVRICRSKSENKKNHAYSLNMRAGGRTTLWQVTQRVCVFHCRQQDNIERETETERDSNRERRIETRTKQRSIE